MGLLFATKFWHKSRPNEPPRAKCCYRSATPRSSDVSLDRQPHPPKSMRTKHLFHHGFLIPRIAAALCLFSGAVFLALFSFAADPPSGTLSAATPRLTYETGPNVQSNPSGQVGVVCNVALPCDEYTLTVNAAGFEGTHNVKITIQWPVPAEERRYSPK